MAASEDQAGSAAEWVDKVGADHVSPRARPQEELAVGGSTESWPAAGETLRVRGSPGARHVCASLS